MTQITVLHVRGHKDLYPNMVSEVVLFLSRALVPENMTWRKYLLKRKLVGSSPTESQWRFHQTFWWDQSVRPDPKYLMCMYICHDLCTFTLGVNLCICPRILTPISFQHSWVQYIDKLLFCPKANQREESYKEQIKTLTTKLKQVGVDSLPAKMSVSFNIFIFLTKTRLLLPWPWKH